MHHGFFSAYHNTTVRPGVLSAVKRAKEVYGDLKIIVTGHSMGGAMAALCALDLAVTITTFLIPSNIFLMVSLLIYISILHSYYLFSHFCYYLVLAFLGSLVYSL